MIDNDDFRDDSSTTGLLPDNTSINAEIEKRGDVDWFEVEVEAGSTYNFSATGDTLQDPMLQLLRADGSQVAFDDDGGGGYNSLIVYETSITESLFLAVSAYQYQYIQAGYTGTGTYTLSSSVTVNDPPQPQPQPISEFSSNDGYGLANVESAFERWLDIDLDDQTDLGGNFWSLDMIGAPEVWEGLGTYGQGITVAVVDTGIDLDHPEFEGRIVPGYDFVDNDTIADDGDGHGTHVAGTIGGAFGQGVTGVAPDVNLMPVRVLDDNGNGYLEDVRRGIIWAAENGAHVINLSLGGGNYNQSMRNAIEYATDLGAVVVMAAGNESSNQPGYPARYATDFGIAVGAIDRQGEMAYFSNKAGPTRLDYVTAPGYDIYSSIPGSSYAYYSGTSMAAPHVAGMAALLMSYDLANDNSLTPEIIENLLIETASHNIDNQQSTNNTSNRIRSQRNLGIKNFDISLPQARKIEPSQQIKTSSQEKVDLKAQVKWTESIDSFDGENIDKEKSFINIFHTYMDDALTNQPLRPIQSDSNILTINDGLSKVSQDINFTIDLQKLSCKETSEYLDADLANDQIKDSGRGLTTRLPSQPLNWRKALDPMTGLMLVG